MAGFINVKLIATILRVCKENFESNKIIGILNPNWKSSSNFGEDL
jgi:hypothetical protein